MEHKIEDLIHIFNQCFEQEKVCLNAPKLCVKPSPSFTAQKITLI